MAAKSLAGSTGSPLAEGGKKGGRKRGGGKSSHRQTLIKREIPYRVSLSEETLRPRNDAIRMPNTMQTAKRRRNAKS